MTSSLVLMDDAFARHLVDYWNRSTIGFFGLGGVASVDGRHHFLNAGAQRRALACISNVALYRLADAFSCLGRISHGYMPASGMLKDRVLCGFLGLLSMLGGL